MINIDEFINKYVIKRSCSMFKADLEHNKELLIRKIKNKSVLVIGGAGSIGSSFVRTIIEYLPCEICVVDINENSLAELTRELRAGGYSVPDKLRFYPMDYKSVTFKRMFRNHRGFDIVANYSAHKHVRSEKDIYSVEALLRNNLINAKGLLDLLCEYPPEEYFCVSTDKAANPVNIMGASKRIMEDLIFSYSNRFPVKTARFANVAFSNGSLPAAFLERIAKSQPISAPKDVKRFFVSPEESGQICLLSAILGENREIFFPKLDTDHMMTFDLISEKLLSELGYEVVYCDSDQKAIEMASELKYGSKKYPVHYSVSDTDGEKSFEEFYTDFETIDFKRFDSLGVITGKQAPNKDKVIKLIDMLEKSFERESVSKEEIIKMLEAYLPEFKHIETGKSLDDKM